jgi:hypothetical protein
LSTNQETCPCGSRDKALRHGLCRKCRKTAGDSVQADRSKAKEGGELAKLRVNYKHALRQLESLEDQLGIRQALKNQIDTFAIKPVHGTGTGEATPVLVASDWHVEETVGSEIGRLNRYTPDIAQKRATKFFASGLRLIRLLQQDVRIEQMVLPLLGDFITGNIHGEENAEKNAMQPMHAIVFAQGLLVSGIDFLLNNSKMRVVVPCHSGNHARTTHTTRFASENGHSLEYLMYLNLADHYRGESRVQFIIPEGMHSYLDIYDQKIRFHHGHAVKYGGGVGGIYIPVNKAIAQWNKAETVSLDVFGHFHQLRDGGNFICNGSLIGYNAYALSIKADYEPPKQALFLMDKKRGRTCTWPVLVE